MRDRFPPVRSTPGMGPQCARAGTAFESRSTAGICSERWRRTAPTDHTRPPVNAIVRRVAGKRAERYAPLDLLPASVIRWIGRQHRNRYLGPLVRRASQRLRERPRTIARGQGRGLRFNPAGTHPGYALGTSEPEIQELLAANVKPGSVMWDVGANVGFLTLIAARLVGPNGQVVAFEPLPSNCEAIRRNLALNQMGNV